MNLNTRKIKRFRCTIDPGIPPSPRNAFDVESDLLEAELTPAGVYVKTCAPRFAGHEFLIPYGNIQAIKLYPNEEDSAVEKKKG